MMREMEVQAVNVREFCAFCTLPFSLDGLVNGTGDQIFCYEVTFDKFNFTSDTAFDRLTAPPSSLGTI